MLAFRFQFARNKHRTKHLFALRLRNGTLLASIRIFLLDLILVAALLLFGKKISAKFYRRNPRSIFVPLLSQLEWRFLEMLNAKSGWKHALQKRLLAASDYLWARAAEPGSVSHYLQPLKGTFQVISLFQDTRPALLGRFNEELRFSGPAAPPRDGVLAFHISFTETVDPLLAGKELSLDVVLVSEGRERKFSVPFSFELDVPSNKTWRWHPGQSWTKVEVPLTATEAAKGVDQVKVSVRHNAAFRAMNAPDVAVASPYVYSVSQRGPRAILFVVESLTDLGLLEKVYGIPRTDRQILEAMGKEGIYYPQAFSSGDATLTSAGTFMTGLLPSAHQTGNYAFNPWLYNSCGTLPKGFPTVAEKIRATGAETFMRASLQRFSPSYGFSRGFDGSYIRQDESVALELDFLTQLGHRPGYLFSHVNTAHMPFHLDSFGAGPDQTLVLKDGNDGDAREFMARANRSFLLLLSLIERMKTLGTWDDCTLVVTGDHGCNLGTWAKGLEFSLYQMRTHVPLFIKPARSLVAKLPASSAIVQAHELGMHAILSTFGLGSAYAHGNSEKFGPYVTTETTHQPGQDDYAACLTSSGFRYFYRAKVDWKKREMLRFEGESLFPVNRDTGLYNETASVTDPETSAHFRALAERDFLRNLARGKEYAGVKSVQH